MSKDVDLNSPLSDEDRSYLSMRGRTAEIERVDALTGSESVPLGEGDGTGPSMQPLMTGDQRVAERDRLLARLRELDAIEGTGDDAEEVDLVPYDAMTPAALSAELKARELPTGGSKAEKIARLEEDDAKDAATE